MGARPLLGEARIVTMRELSQHTSEVMARINEEGRPAFVTRHGRFQAIIWPVASKKVESLVLAHVGELVNLASEYNEDEETPAMSIEEATRELRRSR